FCHKWRAIAMDKWVLEIIHVNLHHQDSPTCPILVRDVDCAPAPLQLQASNSISLNLQSCQCMTECSFKMLLVCYIFLAT
uniref:Uncharacterized protein n=1 Tax=Gopherus evgoodei TaxID=1825980 RepID=A0A8C4VLV6_9SAUR